MKTLFFKNVFFSFFFFKDFIYLFIHERQRERETEAEGEAGSPRSREPDAGLNPRTLGSQPELKADA